MNENNKCLNPMCEKTKVSRSLCQGCYQSAHHLVQIGKTTWKKLEAKGKAMKPVYARATETVNWFLE